MQIHQKTEKDTKELVEHHKQVATDAVVSLSERNSCVVSHVHSESNTLVWPQ